MILVKNLYLFRLILQRFIATGVHNKFDLVYLPAKEIETILTAAHIPIYDVLVVLIPHLSLVLKISIITIIYN